MSCSSGVSWLWYFRLSGSQTKQQLMVMSVSCNRPLFITKRSSSSSAQVGPFPAFSSFHMVNEEGIPFMQRDGFLNGISHILVDDADL